jgi:LAO/AO transport system kinase
MARRRQVSPEDVLAGDRRALARALTLVENDAPAKRPLLEALYPHSGAAHVIGVTGAPGTGKSSLVNRMALELRQQGRTVGIVAVDPTSPFSGGAILGDRIRMRDLSGDPGIFIRSMASRGSLGGLARTTYDVVSVMAAAGFDVVLVETVGAGQSETEVATLAQTTIVVEAPGLGDDIQALKAGILEIADILVVNKADDPRSASTARALQAMLDLGTERPHTLHHGQLIAVVTPPGAPDTGWQVPIQLTNAHNGEGVPDLLDQAAAHRASLTRSGAQATRARAKAAVEVDGLLRDALLAHLLEAIPPERLQQVIGAVAARQTTPHAAVETLMDDLP